MKQIKRWSGLALTAVLLLSLTAVPGVQAEEAPIPITGLEQLDGIQSGSYQLAADLTIPENVILTVPSDVAIIIDLNGHTVSKPSGTGRILENAGNVTINDSSAEKTGLVSSYRNNIGNTGTMVINGGTFETHCNVGGSTLYNDVGGTMTINECVVNADFFAINNEGDMVINGGEFHSTSTNEPGTFAYCVRNYANMTINDATITGIQGALASASGVLTVYDGHFSTEWGNSRSFYALYIAGEKDVVTGYIYGGTYSSPKYAIYIGNDNKGGDGGINADATTFVYGGTYNGGISAIYRAQQTGNPYVSGGTFRKGEASNDAPDPVVEDYMAEGCVYDDTTGQVTDPRIFSVAFDTERVTLSQGGSMMLQATVDAGADADTTVSFSSDNTAVATVAPNGLLTAVSAGNAVITATVGDKSAVCPVVVVGTPQLPAVDPEKPVDKVEVGVAGDSAEVIDDTLTQVVEKVLSDMDIGEAVDDTTKAAIKEAVEQDKPITIVIKTESLSSSQVDAGDAVKVEAAAGADAEVAQYLDISMILQADGQEIGTLNRLTRPITVQVAIPEDMLADGRTFCVIRVHHGVAEKLNTVVRDGVASFETDRFSTYVLVYEDAPSSGSSETSPETSAPTGSSVPSAPSTPSTPPTGRQNMWPVVLAASLLALSAALAAVAGRRNRKADHVK